MFVVQLSSGGKKIFSRARNEAAVTALTQSWHVGVVNYCIFYHNIGLGEAS